MWFVTGRIISVIWLATQQQNGLCNKWKRMASAVYKTAEGTMRKNTGLSKKMDGIWNRYNLKSNGRICTFGVLKCSEKFKVLDLP